MPIASCFCAWAGCEEVHELPFGYNANADANVTRAEWSRVRLLHDIVVQRKRGWGRSGYAALVEELTRRSRDTFARAEALKRTMVV